MTSTSPERVVLRDLAHDTVETAPLGQDLRTGRWTRLGHTTVLGDPVAEGTLQELAERTRTAAQAQGYAVGWAAGCRTAMAQATAAADEKIQRHDEELLLLKNDQQQAMSALVDLTARLEAAFNEARAGLEERAAALAIEIAEAVLGREIQLSKDPGADAVRRALDLTPATAVITVRMHPADRAALDTSGLDFHSVRLVDDPTLRRGDAIAETEDSVVEATLTAALDRVRRVLAP